MPTLECDAALSDLVLQAARQAIPAHVDHLITLPPTSQRNLPLMPLLVALLDAVQTTAAAVADNAHDEASAIDRQLARELAQQARAIASDIEDAARA
jgi:hypothetical protein